MSCQVARLELLDMFEDLPASTGTLARSERTIECFAAQFCIYPDHLEGDCKLDLTFSTGDEHNNEHHCFSLANLEGHVVLSCPHGNLDNECWSKLVFPFIGETKIRLAGSCRVCSVGGHLHVLELLGFGLGPMPHHKTCTSSHACRSSFVIRPLHSSS